MISPSTRVQGGAADQQTSLPQARTATKVHIEKKMEDDSNHSLFIYSWFHFFGQLVKCKKGSFSKAVQKRKKNEDKI